MKKSIYLSFLLCLFWACEEEKIFTFADRPEVFFDKFYMDAIYPGTEGADSTEVSFFHYPDGTKDIEVPLVVCLSGNLLTEGPYVRVKSRYGRKYGRGRKGVYPGSLLYV